MEEIKKQEVRSAAEIAIRNINRCLTSWNKRAKENQYLGKITHTEVRGLVNNWLCKCLRDCIGTNALNHLMREGKPIMQLSPSGDHVINIYFCQVRTYASQQLRDDVQEIFSQIKYDQLRYNEEDYKQDNIVPKSLVASIDGENVHYDSSVNISFDDIKSIKY
jgi:hypothetical protein